MITQKNFLTKSEKSALEKIAKESKMDSWFSINSYVTGDFIYDFEEDKELALEDGIGQLTEGIAYNAEFYGLTYNEGLELNYLFEVFGVPFRFAKYNDKEKVYFNLTEYQRLFLRVRRELEEYERELATMPAEKIIYRSYQTVCKKEIVQVIEQRTLSKKQVEALVMNAGNSVLDYLYDCYLDSCVETTTLYEDLISNIIEDGVADE